MLVLISLVFPAGQLPGEDHSRGVALVDTEPLQADQGRFVVAVIGIDDYQHWPKLDNAVQDTLGTNPTSDTWHVYMIDIDQDGRINPIPLWQSDTQFDELAGGLTETTYTIKHRDSGPGVSEFRLCASRKRVHELLSPPSTAAARPSKTSPC